MALMIDLQKLVDWRLDHITSGKAQSYDDMTALLLFINNVETIEMGQCRSCAFNHDMVSGESPMGYYHCHKMNDKYISERWCSEWKGRRKQ